MTVGSSLQCCWKNLKRAGSMAKKIGRNGSVAETTMGELVVWPKRLNVWAACFGWYCRNTCRRTGMPFGRNDCGIFLAVLANWQYGQNDTVSAQPKWCGAFCMNPRQGKSRSTTGMESGVYMRFLTLRIQCFFISLYEEMYNITLFTIKIPLPALFPLC